MTRARLVWATSSSFAAVAELAIENALRRARDAQATAAHVLEMRALMARERPPQGFWDMKLNPGGLVDIEFCAQHLQLVHAGAGGPLKANTGEALTALAEAGVAPAAPVAQLRAAWTLQQNLSQLLKIALEDQGDPGDEPKPLRALLARAGGARDFRSLKARLAAARAAVIVASRSLIGPPA
jgi:glutamate-ammonia-ligase adenylyltransferase